MCNHDGRFSVSLAAPFAKPGCEGPASSIPCIRSITGEQLRDIHDGALYYYDYTVKASSKKAVTEYGTNYAMIHCCNMNYTLSSAVRTMGPGFPAQLFSLHLTPSKGAPPMQLR
jgi:hypothetical protein